MLSGFTSATLPAEFSERVGDLPGQARLHGGFQLRVPLPHDLVHRGGPHACALKLCERLAGVHGIELFFVPDQDDPGQPQFLRDAQELAHLVGGSERRLVHHQHRSGKPPAQRPGALPRQPPFGDAGVPGEEPLQRFALDPGFARQRLDGRSRRGEPDQLEAPFLGQGPGAAQHGGLARPGVALHADHAVLRRQDQLHRIFLPRRQRAPMQPRLHDPAPHDDPRPVPALAHQADALAFLGQRPVGGHAVAAFEPRRTVQPAFLFQRPDGPFGGLHRHRPRSHGERGREQVRSREHGLAFGKMRRGPFHRLDFPPVIRWRQGLCGEQFLCGRQFPCPRQSPSGRQFPGRYTFRCRRLTRSSVSGIFRRWRANSFLRSLPCLRHRLAGVEPQCRGLLLPVLAQRALVDVTLVRTRHERRAFSHLRVILRIAQAPFGHCRLDLGATGGKRLDDLP